MDARIRSSLLTRGTFVSPSGNYSAAVSGLGSGLLRPFPVLASPSVFFRDRKLKRSSLRGRVTNDNLLSHPFESKSKPVEGILDPCASLSHLAP